MHLARAWGAETVILPEAGHINVKSGHGAWEGAPCTWPAPGARRR